MIAHTTQPLSALGALNGHADNRPMLLTSKQAAAALSISERTLFTYTKAGLIACVYLPSTGTKQPNKVKRYAISELERFINEHQRKADLLGAESAS